MGRASSARIAEFKDGANRIQRREPGSCDIPEADIRRRYDASRENLVLLMPRLASLRIYDNSTEGDPVAGRRPKPRLILHLEHGRIIAPSDLRDTPSWAKALVARAIEISGSAANRRS